jgi:hypothetical protein
VVGIPLADAAVSIIIRRRRRRRRRPGDAYAVVDAIHVEVAVEAHGGGGPHEAILVLNVGLVMQMKIGRDERKNDEKADELGERDLPRR